jgi:aconitate hydratase
MAFDINMIREVYSKMEERVNKARQITGKHLTLTEKILYSHLWDGIATEVFSRGGRKE